MDLGHKIPVNSSGVVELPRGSRGPRSLYIRRHGGSFGFTLRHFIVYPPDSIADGEGDGLSGVAALRRPMDTIFVKAVREGGAARRSGLRPGDRLVAVNGQSVAGASYSAVVHAISNSPEFLHLLVLPKEEDVLQRFYTKLVYNPASNQPHSTDDIGPHDVAAAQRIIGRQLAQQQQLQQRGRRPERTQQPARVQVDAASWRQLQQGAWQYAPAYAEAAQAQLQAAGTYKEPRRVEATVHPQPSQAIYAEIEQREAASARQRAAPQVPLYRKSGRRASDGSAPVRAALTQRADMLAPGCADGIAYRLSLDAGRRDSSSSLSSSLADGSKDSIASYDSAATLTGHETDDSLMSRLRQSFQQKEEFLRAPPPNLPAREFYSRPGRLERTQWPPPEETAPPPVAAMPRQHPSRPEDGLRQAATAPKFEDTPPTGAKNPEEEEATAEETRRAYPSLQIVQRRAREFESGRPLPEDDPAAVGREERSRSELARLGAKRLVPCVTERAQEYDARAELPPPRRQDSAGEAPPVAAAPAPAKKAPPSPTLAHRDARSLDSSETQEAEDEVRSMRARSNSVDSWASAKVNSEDKPVVIKRRHKNTNLGDDERAMRRESYLKATEGGRMYIDSDLSDGGDISPQVLRSGSVSGNSSGSNASLDGEKLSPSPGPSKDLHIIKEGYAHVKILEIDGKRANDRSWKQVYMVLQGPKLFLFKDKHHQSPIGTTGLSGSASSEPLDVGLVNGVDIRASAVRVANDYTKKKHVLRVSAARPIRAELLLRAHDDVDFADWTRAFHLQAAENTDAELDPAVSTQRAMPQMTPATTSVQVPGLSGAHSTDDQPKSGSLRARSPTGQSPVSKTRRQPGSISGDILQPCPQPATSPKAKTWRGRVAKQFRRLNPGTSSPNSPTAPEGSTFGIPIEDCLPSSKNPYVPRFVEVCTDIIDTKGLQTVGIYRVCGNNAAITALTEEVNKNYDDVPLDNTRWNDLHVVSSLLKSYFRKMPDSLVTASSYPQFIAADKIEDPTTRLGELKRLVKLLPKHNYHTLKHIILHLKRVADNSEVNRMEAKNLAIVFGPTIVRPEGDTIESMVNNMTNQCKIVESLITHAEWFFPDIEDEDKEPVPLTQAHTNDDFESHSQQILLDNISKYEALTKDQNQKNGALFSSIISAAQRKVKRKPSKDNSRYVSNTPTSPKLSQHQLPNREMDEGSNRGITSMMSAPMSDAARKIERFNYATDSEEFQRRVQNFMQETQAMLERPRKMEISIPIDPRGEGHLSTSSSNVNQNAHLSTKPTDLHHFLTKTQSASNVFVRGADGYPRNSLNSVDGNISHYRLSDSAAKSSVSGKSDSYYRSDNCTNGNVSKHSSVEVRTGGLTGMLRDNTTRGNSVENINSGMLDMGTSANMKKIKFENEIDAQRMGSLDSLTKLQNDDESLLSTMTKLYDQKLKEPPQLTPDEDIPYADESPEKHPKDSDKENIPRASDLYKNPSLHKSLNIPSKAFKKTKSVSEKSEKEEDTMASIDEPDNERHIVSNKLSLVNPKISPKLKRSESLNKPERNSSPLHTKLKRSESLNKPTGDKLKRCDSLTKNEKTESNINKKRELTSGRKIKDVTKNKRKNGMPDRSIKRRHTVGGTKDPDKVTYMMDNKNQNNSATQDIQKEKNLRTSSPDLSSTRRDKFFLEITIGPVVALRQNIVGGRPQSFPEGTAIFKVPLESHV